MAKRDPINSFRDLVVWQKAMEALDLVLEICEQEPLKSKFWLCNQLGASSASVPANIAEGHDGGSRRIYLKHLYYSGGSRAETITYLQAIGKRKYADRQSLLRLWKLYVEIGKMLNALINKIEQEPPGTDEVE